jgi:hypothetical protein
MMEELPDYSKFDQEDGADAEIDPEGPIEDVDFIEVPRAAKTMNPSEFQPLPGRNKRHLGPIGTSLDPPVKFPNCTLKSFLQCSGRNCA